MSLIKYMLGSGFIGFLTSIFFILLWWLIDNHINIDFVVRGWIQNAMLCLWPSSIVNLAGAGGGNLATNIMLASVAMNAVLYSVLGAVFWLGLNKHKAFFVILVLVLVALWWKLLTL